LQAALMSESDTLNNDWALRVPLDLTNLHAKYDPF
jgi:hypothetical protein